MRLAIQAGAQAGWAVIERIMVLPNTVRAALAPGEASTLLAAWGLQAERVVSIAITDWSV